MHFFVACRFLSIARRFWSHNYSKIYQLYISQWFFSIAWRFCCQNYCKIYKLYISRRFFYIFHRLKNTKKFISCRLTIKSITIFLNLRNTALETISGWFYLRKSSVFCSLLIFLQSFGKLSCCSQIL